MTDEPLIGPRVQYPTPWRVAEKRGDVTVIVCADGHYTGEIPDGKLAGLVVEAVNVYAARSAEATCEQVLPVTYHETEIENVTEVEYDRGLYQTVDEAVRTAAWHSSSSKDLPWVDGYSADFTAAVLRALAERYVIVPKGDNHG
jgi:hypothetical protein